MRPLPVAAEVSRTRPLRVSTWAPTGMFAAPVRRVRFPAADVTKTCPETTPTTTDLPGTGGEAPPVGPMPRTRTSDSAPDDVSQAATPMWSAAAAARSWPMPSAPGLGQQRPRLPAAPSSDVA